ncbi:MAG TPA: IS1380 family transposase, partial [Myxococcota bacterium]|nr:IS1380 family transposase [Myxococcota bacterium]
MASFRGRLRIERCGFSRLTIDADGTVLRTGVRVEGAERGYNPHPPKDKSYYPLTAQLAQTGQILRVWNRPGNVHDSHGAEGFLRTLLRDLR